MVLVTGYVLKAAEKYWRSLHMAQVAEAGLGGTAHVYAETKLAALAAARTEYERGVAVTVDGETQSLADARVRLELRQQERAWSAEATVYALARHEARLERLRGVIADGMTTKYEVELDPTLLKWDEPFIDPA